jgi:pimeloyl-ACP methyl ester carboxylesterase
LTDAGYRVAVPDVRGYGGSDCPDAIEAYDMQTLTADMAAIAQQLSPREPAVIVGHDWGAPIAWNSALLYPDQFRAVGGLSVPHVPPGDVLATDLFKKIFTDRGFFYYMLYFQQPGVAEAELEADPARSIRLFYSAIAGDASEGAWPQAKPIDSNLFDGIPEPDLPRPWLSVEDVSYYAQQFARSGFHGPLNRYRNFARDSRFLKTSGKNTISQPSLYITGDKDMVSQLYPNGPVAAMQPYASDVRVAHTLPGCGHWTQQERPAEVNELLLSWLESL